MNADCMVSKGFEIAKVRSKDGSARFRQGHDQRIDS